MRSSISAVDPFCLLKPHGGGGGGGTKPILDKKSYERSSAVSVRCSCNLSGPVVLALPVSSCPSDSCVRVTRSAHSVALSPSPTVLPAVTHIRNHTCTQIRDRHLRLGACSCDRGHCASLGAAIAAASSSPRHIQGILAEGITSP